MASIFGHVVASTALGYAFFPKQTRTLTLLLAGFCAFAPDLDVLAFRFGIPYDSEWGHRGWTHSAAFAVMFGTAMGWLHTGGFSRQRVPNTAAEHTRIVTMWFIISTLSHPLLDMLTDGGRGCALWWPFSDERLFFPVRPIVVSPMSIGSFISEWGLTVLVSEMMWIGLPALGLVLLAKLFRKR